MRLLRIRAGNQEALEGPMLALLDQAEPIVADEAEGYFCVLNRETRSRRLAA